MNKCCLFNLYLIISPVDSWIFSVYFQLNLRTINRFKISINFPFLARDFIRQSVDLSGRIGQGGTSWNVLHKIPGLQLFIKVCSLDWDKSGHPLDKPSGPLGFFQFLHDGLRAPDHCERLIQICFCKNWRMKIIKRKQNSSYIFLQVSC